MKPEVDEIDEDNPFYGRAVVFTGALSCYRREDAAQIVVNLGGRCVGSVSKKTNFVVVGQFDSRTFAAGRDKSTKLEKAETLASDGCDIEIISDLDFQRMIAE